jgi:alkylation response protein AidB-like acyl-CoA dehydrogenase
MRSCEEVMMLTRILARRDMNVAVSESTQIWALLVWIGGDAAQREQLARAMLADKVIPCLAYSEPEHGADLLANDFSARPDAGGYVLTGRKWPINRAATSTHVVLLARTGPTASAFDQSMFLVEKRGLDQEQVSEMPRVATHGLRGCDIGGIVFRGARVPASARLGREGRGVELALRGLALTRTLCAGLSLGVADTLLRTASEYLAQRQLYAAPVAAIPHVRETLANAYLSLLVAECASLVSMRGLHLFPEEAGTWSVMTKVQVTRQVDRSTQALVGLMGARSYLRSGPDQGTFQKMVRDSAVVSLFDGSEPVCLDGLAAQLPAMGRAVAKPRDEDWTRLYDLRVPLEDFGPEKVRVHGRGSNAVLASLPGLIDALDAIKSTAGCQPDRLAALRVLAKELQRQLNELFDGVREMTGAQLAPGAVKRTPTRLVRLAESCCALFASVASLGVWVYNRDHLDGFFADGAWLEASLRRTAAHQFDTGDLPPEVTAELYDRMTQQREESKYFSVIKLQQAEPFRRETSDPERKAASVRRS